MSTEPADYIARIRAKGLADTGVTEEVARRFYGRRGSHVMLIVEAKIEETGDTADGQHKVILTVQQVEPATDPRLDDHLRELTRALHHQRRLHDEDEQPQLDGVSDVEPTVEQVMAAGAGQVLTCANCLHKLDAEGIVHQPDESDSDGCTWAVCGHLVHADDTHCTKTDCQNQEEAVPANT